MKIIVDIAHPAHVHYFRNLASKLKNKHDFLFTARKKECVEKLLNYYQIKHIVIGEHKNGLFNKIINIFLINIKLLIISKKFKPDLFIGFGSFSVAQVAFLMRKKSLIFEDTEHSRFQNLLYRFFATHIITSICFQKNYGKKHIKIDSFMELAYLHPNCFNPNLNVLKELDIKKGEKYFILRFVAWEASHDIKYKGLTTKTKRKLIKLLTKYGKVFISSEKPLSNEFEKYRLNISPEKIHDVLYYSTMCISEGGTMASECAVLATPAIYINELHMGYTDEEQNKYGLIFQTTSKKQIKNKIDEWVNNKNLKKEWQKKRKILLKNQIDLTEWMINFIEKYNR